MLYKSTELLGQNESAQNQEQRLHHYPVILMTILMLLTTVACLRQPTASVTQESEVTSTESRTPTETEAPAPTETEAPMNANEYLEKIFKVPPALSDRVTIENESGLDVDEISEIEGLANERASSLFDHYEIVNEASEGSPSAIKLGFKVSPTGRPFFEIQAGGLIDSGHPDDEGKATVYTAENRARLFVYPNDVVPAYPREGDLAVIWNPDGSNTIVYIGVASEAAAEAAGIDQVHDPSTGTVATKVLAGALFSAPITNGDTVYPVPFEDLGVTEEDLVEYLRHNQPNDEEQTSESLAAHLSEQLSADFPTPAFTIYPGKEIMNPEAKTENAKYYALFKESNTTISLQGLVEGVEIAPDSSIIMYMRVPQGILVTRIFHEDFVKIYTNGGGDVLDGSKNIREAFIYGKDYEEETIIDVLKALVGQSVIFELPSKVESYLESNYTPEQLDSDPRLRALLASYRKTAEEDAAKIKTILTGQASADQYPWIWSASDDIDLSLVQENLDNLPTQKGIRLDEDQRSSLASQVPETDRVFNR